ncbi:MAG: metallophosphoesterase [Candidatus Eisenbacteria bacterium]
MSRRTILAAAVVCVLVAHSLPVAAEASGNEVFRFAILSDRTGGHTPGVYPKVIAAINAQNPAFVVTVGDHIEGYGEDYDRAEAEWDSLFALLRTIEAPVYVTPGNHDMWDDTSQALYKARTGRDPDYSFDHENTHFVILDNSRIESWDRMGISKITWLMRDLAQAETKNIFVFFHKPFWDQTLRRGERDTMHEILLEGGVDAVFCGHYHRYFAGEYDGIEYTTIGSSGGAIDESAAQPTLTGEFFQFAMVSVLEDGYELEIHDVATGEVYPRDMVTVELLDEIELIHQEFIDVSPVSVSGDGDERSHVTLSVHNGTGKTLDGEAVWDVPGQWLVEPASAGYSVAPGATQEMTFAASRSGAIYPVPSVSLSYPLADGRNLEIESPARVVRKVRAPRVTQTVTLDGEVDAFLLEHGGRETELYTGSGYEAVEGETEFIFAHDTGNLFVSAICHDDAMDELQSAAGERDAAVYRDDCVGFFFQPDPEDLTVYQIYVNADGVVFDQSITFDENMWWTVHPEWNGEYGVAASRGDDRWTVEMQIPMETFKSDAERGDRPEVQTLGSKGTRTWRLNFRRKQQRTGGAADWQVPIDYNPESFGEIDLQ